MFPEKKTSLDQSPADNSDGGLRDRPEKMKVRERKEGKELKPRKGPVKKIQARTKARAEAARSAPEVHRLEKKLNRFFKWGLLVSFLAHAPILFGRTDEEGNHYWSFGFFDFGGGQNEIRGIEKKIGDEEENPKLKEEMKDETPPQWEEEVRKSLEKDLGQKDAEKLMEEIDPEALAGFKKAQEAIKQRKSERAGRIDQAKFDEYKKNLLERLEHGEKILFRDFVFEVELLGLGIEPDVIEKAKAVFMEEMQELEKEKPDVPTREFLQKVVGLSEKDEKNDAYEPTRTSLAEYLVRKKEGKRGNCKARGKYQAMALEYLYPERRKDILMQEFGDHIRALFEVDENIFVMEPGVQILKKDDLDGTITFSLDEYMLSTAGREIVKHVEKSPQEKQKPDLPTINDDTAFREPKADGLLKNASNNHQFLYKQKFTPPETQKMELPPSSREIHEQNEKIRQQQEYEEQKQKYDEETARYNRNLERAKKAGERPAQPVNPLEVAEVAEWVVVLDEGKVRDPNGVWKEEDLEEILPWRQTDYPDIELSDRIQWKTFIGGRMAFGWGKGQGEIPGLTNPSPATIKKINGFALENVEYEGHTIYGQNTWHEIFDTSIPHVNINLGSARLSLGFSHFLASKKGEIARKYRGELGVTVQQYQGITQLNDVESRKKSQPFSEFKEDDLRLLLQGEGGIRLRYPERDFSEKEIEMITQSTRPYVFVDGALCNFEAKALLKMKDSKKTVLVLTDSVYFEVMHRLPELLLEPHIKAEHEFFPQEKYMINPVHVLLNAYTLRETLNRSAGEHAPGASDQLAKLNELIRNVEVKFMNSYRDASALGQAQLEHIQKTALEHYQNTFYDGPIGCMGFCPPPDEIASNYYVDRDVQIQKYQKPTESKSDVDFGGRQTVKSADGTKIYQIQVTPSGLYQLQTFRAGTNLRESITTIHRYSDGEYVFTDQNGQTIQPEPELQTIVHEFIK